MFKTYLFVLTLAFASRGFAQPCHPEAIQQASAVARALHAKLLAIPSAREDSMAYMSPQLYAFKQSLIKTADAALSCYSSTPTQLQTNLAGLLHANRPAKRDRAMTDADVDEMFKPTTGVYGAELQVAVKNVTNEQDMISIDFNFCITCGGDNVLLIYRRTPAGYHREITYFNPDVKEISDAFGDFLSWTFVPGSKGKQLFAAAHGTPWCQSRMSAFHLDLIAPATAEDPQKTLDHRDEGYSRFEKGPLLKSTPDGASIRVENDSLDFDNLFIRPRIYRFQTTEDKFTRIQPIALNVRDFVDAWIQLPWEQASKWAENPNQSLQAERDRFDYEKRKHDDNTSLSTSFGPTRACTSRTQTFQTEMHLITKTYRHTDDPVMAFVLKNEKKEVLYARVQQSPTGFTMLSITPNPDPTCTGPDIMKPAKHP